MSSTLIMLIENIKSSIKDSLSNAMIRGEIPTIDLPEINIEIPSDRKYGDLSSNIAMASAKIFKMSPKKLANIILSDMRPLSSLIEKYEIAGSGFINFFFDTEFYSEVLNEANSLGKRFGKSNIGNGKKVIIEFISANPTGPMHIGNARGGALGDCLSEILDAAGYDVYREFYVNDAGNQIEKFGISLDIRYQQIWKGENSIELPEDCYQGNDIKDLAQKFSEQYSNTFIEKNENERRKALIEFALPININNMKSDISKYKIKFDNWFYESDLYKSGEVQTVIEKLKERGYTYELDGALWYKATLFGAKKDEVLVRQNGIPTYFASDIAYHKNKIETRQFDMCINILGADHHGHVDRMINAMSALGIDKSRLHIMIFQLVRLVKDGETLRMSKRTGDSIQLSDLLEEVNSNSARFIFNMYEPNSDMDFDLDLAVKKDSQNPVYYVQYAYARICSIFNSCGIEMTENIKNKRLNLSVLNSKEEKDLIFHISTLTGGIIKASKYLDPTKITRYAITLANLFHKFYTAHKVLVDEPEIMYSRLFLCNCVRIVLKNIFDMLKIDAPEEM